METNMNTLYIDDNSVASSIFFLGYNTKSEVEFVSSGPLGLQM